MDPFPTEDDGVFDGTAFDSTVFDGTVFDLADPGPTADPDPLFGFAEDGMESFDEMELDAVHDFLDHWPL